MIASKVRTAPVIFGVSLVSHFFIECKTEEQVRWLSNGGTYQDVVASVGVDSTGRISEISRHVRREKRTARKIARLSAALETPSPLSVANSNLSASRNLQQVVFASAASGEPPGNGTESVKRISRSSVERVFNEASTRVNHGPFALFSTLATFAQSEGSRVKLNTRMPVLGITIVAATAILAISIVAAMFATKKYFYWQIGNLARDALKAKLGGDSSPVWELHRNRLIDSRTSSPLYRRFVELLTNEKTLRAIATVFRALAGDADRLSYKELEDFCLGIYGETVWAENGIVEQWPGDTKAEHWWILNDFDVHFPSERPLDETAFIDVALLVLHWRVALQFYQARIQKYGAVCFSRLKPGESLPSFAIRAEVRLLGNEVPPIPIFSGHIRAFDMHTANVGFYEPEYRAIRSRAQMRYHSPSPERCVPPASERSAGLPVVSLASSEEDSPAGSEAQQ